MAAVIAATQWIQFPCSWLFAAIAPKQRAGLLARYQCCSWYTLTAAVPPWADVTSPKACECHNGTDENGTEGWSVHLTLSRIETDSERQECEAQVYSELERERLSHRHEVEVDRARWDDALQVSHL